MGVHGLRMCWLETIEFSICKHISKPFWGPDCKGGPSLTPRLPPAQLARSHEKCGIHLKQPGPGSWGTAQGMGVLEVRGRELALGAALKNEGGLLDEGAEI